MGSLAEDESASVRTWHHRTDGFSDRDTGPRASARRPPAIHPEAVVALSWLSRRHPSPSTGGRDDPRAPTSRLVRSGQTHQLLPRRARAVAASTSRADG